VWDPIRKPREQVQLSANQPTVRWRSSSGFWKANPNRLSELVAAQERAAHRHQSFPQQKSAAAKLKISRTFAISEVPFAP
jgi:hypothetical protein